MQRRLAFSALVSAGCALALPGYARRVVDQGQAHVQESPAAPAAMANEGAEASAQQVADAEIASSVVRTPPRHESALSQMGAPSAASGAGAAPDFWSVPRSVWLRRSATGEQVRCTYWADGQVRAREYEQVCWLLRDVRMTSALEDRARSGQRTPQGWYGYAAIDVNLLDVLYALSAWLDLFGKSAPLQILSGFRHPVTNSATEGAARSSEHTRGAAADIHVAGVSVEALGRFGQWLGAGGVGFYPSRGFLHLDSGRVRSWSDKPSGARRR